jgi:methylmalonyl-CoA mutase cobalamin-binding subunit
VTAGALPSADLPSGRTVLAEGLALGRRLRVGRTLFCRVHGVASEAAYKRRMRARGEITFHAQYGLSSWAASAEGLREVHAALERRGARLDRFGLCLDRAMGLPPAAREATVAESGLKLRDDAEWRALGEVVPVQPHLGDHMIGSPAGDANTVRALEAGVTSVGNLAQFFTYEYPGWTDQVARAVATVRALGVMAAHAGAGAIVHSNLDDGWGGLFTDRVSILGWAILERRLAEDLAGAALTHCFGNLVPDPPTRLAFLWALDRVHGGETAGSMVNANTLVTPDRERNAAILAGSFLWDALGQLHRPTGHALQGLPLTEHERIPSPAEIVEAQLMAHELAGQARAARPLLAVEPVEALEAELLAGGREVAGRVLGALGEAGVDVDDPLHLLLALKALAPEVEARFGLGAPDPALPGGRRPVVPTEMFRAMRTREAEMRAAVEGRGLAGALRGQPVVLASADVHVYGKAVVRAALEAAGAHVVDLGASVDPEAVARAAGRAGAPAAVAVSLHNGAALAYARRLRAALASGGLAGPVFVGGRFNQDVGQALPADVEAELGALGVTPAHDPLAMIEALARPGRPSEGLAR